jgi:hypothetical protein
LGADHWRRCVFLIRVFISSWSDNQLDFRARNPRILGQTLDIDASRSRPLSQP